MYLSAVGCLYAETAKEILLRPCFAPAPSKPDLAFVSTLAAVIKTGEGVLVTWAVTMDSPHESSRSSQFINEANKCGRASLRIAETLVVRQWQRVIFTLGPGEWTHQYEQAARAGTTFTVYGQGSIRGKVLGGEIDVQGGCASAGLAAAMFALLVGVGVPETVAITGAVDILGKINGVEYIEAKLNAVVADGRIRVVYVSVDNQVEAAKWVRESLAPNLTVVYYGTVYELLRSLFVDGELFETEEPPRSAPLTSDELQALQSAAKKQKL